MNWKRAGIGIGAAIPVVALLSFGLTRDPSLIPSPLPGKAAPTFALRTMDAGDSIRLADLHGQVVVLNFWASWCLACRDEHATLAEAAALYQPLGVRFFGVLYDDSPGNGKAYIQEMGGQGYPTLLDPETRTAISYGLYGVPETFFIARDGRVAYKQIGPVSLDGMRKILDPLLAEKAPPAASGREISRSPAPDRRLARQGAGRQESR